MTTFQYHPEILHHFPNTNAAIIIADGVRNSTSSPRLKEKYVGEQQIVIEKIGTNPLSEIDTLAAWRNTFRQFGVNPTKYRSAPEALLRRLTKKGDIPSINSVVDVCNLVSIRYAIPVAAFDLRSINTPLTVRFSSGDEPFIPLGSDQVETPDDGEVIFVDEAGVVSARRWCWRQTNGSAAKKNSEHIVFTIEAQHSGGRLDVERAANDLLRFISEFCGGKQEHSYLNQDNLSL